MPTTNKHRRKRIRTYDCDECRYSLLCLAGRLSFHIDNDIDIVNRSFTTSGGASACPRCGVLTIRAEVLGWDKNLNVYCKPREEAVLTYGPRDMYAIGEVFWMTDPALGGCKMLVKVCIACHIDVIERKKTEAGTFQVTGVIDEKQVHIVNKTDGDEKRLAVWDDGTGAWELKDG